MNNIINIILNIFLGMSIVGTFISVVLFLIIKISKSNFFKGMLVKFCVLFSITWITVIVLNVISIMKKIT